MNLSLYTGFVDYEKTFDSNGRKSLEIGEVFWGGCEMQSFLSGKTNGSTWHNRCAARYLVFIMPTACRLNYKVNNRYNKEIKLNRLTEQLGNLDYAD